MSKLTVLVTAPTVDVTHIGHRAGVLPTRADIDNACENAGIRDDTRSKRRAVETHSDAELPRTVNSKTRHRAIHSNETVVARAGAHVDE